MHTSDERGLQTSRLVVNVDQSVTGLLPEKSCLVGAEICAFLLMRYAWSGLLERRDVQKPGTFFTPSGREGTCRARSTSTGSGGEENASVNRCIGASALQVTIKSSSATRTQLCRGDRYSKHSHWLLFCSHLSSSSKKKGIIGNRINSLT